MSEAMGTGSQATVSVPAPRDYVRLTGLACASVVLLVALLGLAGGLSGHRVLEALPAHVPMAPSTALLFLVLGGLLLRLAADPVVAGCRARPALFLALGCAALLNLAGALFSLPVNLLDMFFQRVSAWAGVPHTDMSPATAALFILCSAASWALSLGRRAAPVPGLRAAGLLGAAVALCGGTFLLGYVFGTPLLYGSGLVPMARSTALGFLFLGAALVCEAGPGLLPLRLFAGPSTRALLLRAFVPLTVALSLAHSLVLGLSGPLVGHGNALVAAVLAVGYAVTVGLVVLLAARRVGESLELARAQVLAVLGEKTVLLQELHHRVKNNMQIVSSLFSLQAEYVVDPRDRVLFEESRERILSMAMLHEGLYQSEDLSKVNMGLYVPRLVEQLTGGAEPPVRRVYEVEDLQLSVSQSLPFGMVLNELVMNAKRHAFAGAGEPVLRVALRSGGGEVTLEVEDNGPGVAPGFDLRAKDTFGMLLADSLAGQLHGRLTAENTGRGARFVLRFPAVAA